MTEEQREQHQRLHDAIDLSACEYCLAPAFEPCVSFRGTDRPDAHISRLHAAHVLLVEWGIATPVSKLVVKHSEASPRSHKGLVRKHFLKRLARAARSNSHHRKNNP